MNRRSFLKTTALAAVAVPVVGLPDLPVKPDEYIVEWLGHDGITKGKFFTSVYEHANDFMADLMIEDQANHLMTYKFIELRKNGDRMYLWD